jgi:hypothetical protein
VSRCGPVVPVLDADNPLYPVRGGCVVHTHYAPCPLDGEPACPLPLHSDAHPSLEAVLAFHAERTLGQRPLVLHRGRITDLGPDGQEHVVSERTDCWCGPTLYPPQEVP